MMDMLSVRFFRTLMIFAITGSLLASADQPTSQGGIRKQGYPEASAVVPPSLLYPAQAPQVRRELEEIDTTELLREDEEQMKEGERTRRLGIFRTLNRPVRLGVDWDESVWQRMDDGSHLWTMALTARRAASIRFGVDLEAFPDQGKVIVHDGLAGEQAFQVFPAHQRKVGDRLWTETIWRESAVLEVWLPPGVDPGAVRFTVARIVHGYVPWKSLALAKVGACHGDVSCYPQWANQASAVAGIGFVNNSGSMFCTGCMLSDGAPISFDNHYFLTANHCIGNQASANSLEFYWFYQSSSCNGTVPNINTVPRTGGGADYLAGASLFGGTDVTLLRLRNPPPNGVFYAGWSAQPVATGSSIATIHHPDGSYKRISGGSMRFAFRRFWVTSWGLGATEPGSSGAPLFNGNGQVIGQLYGGFSSCRRPTAPDVYGRFDVSFPLLSNFLAPKSRDLAFLPLRRDFTGNGRDDLAVFWPPGGMWYIKSVDGSLVTTQQWGSSESIPVPGDYNGDDRTDLAVFDPVDGMWTIASADGTPLKRVQWGGPEMIPVPGDYDGDGVTDLAVYRSATGEWFIWESAAQRLRRDQWGWQAARPVPGDYDGDGLTDLAVYEPAQGMWYIHLSSAQRLRQVQWGWNEAVPVPADYDGDGQADLAVYHRASATWYQALSGGGTEVRTFGDAGAVAVPADYDGDTLADLAVFHPRTGEWDILPSASGEAEVYAWGWNRAYPAAPLAE